MTGQGRRVELALPEVHRNRLLRRVDWRFLLPNPSPKRSMCFCTGELAEAVKIVSEHVIVPEEGISADCDLAVCLDSTLSTLLQAYKVLRPGGSLYLECYSPFLTVRRLRKRLADAGFGAISFYFPQSNPSHSRPEQWIPLNSFAALRYARMNRKPARTRARRVSRAVHDILRLSTGYFRLGYPLCAIAQKQSEAMQNHATAQGGAASRPNLSSLADAVRCRWTAWGLGETPPQISLLLLTGGLRSINKVVGLVFAGSETLPRLALKMARVPESLPGLIREAQTLQVLQRRGQRMRGVPKVLFWEQQPEFWMIGQSIVAGRRLSMVLTLQTARQLARQATTWLVELAGEQRQLAAVDWKNCLVEPVLKDFGASFGDAVDPRMLNEAEVIVRSLRPLPVICEQRDFSPWNLIISASGELAVLDWESSELQGVPALDLIYFLTYLGIYLDKAHASGRYGESYRATLDPSTAVGNIAAECLELYSPSVGILERDLHPLRLLTWMLHSRSAYRQLRAEVGGAPRPDQLRRALFIQLWEAELRYGESSRTRE